MGRRGPQSEKHSKIAILYGKRPKPPRHLCREAKKTWRQIVESLPPDRFRVADQHLLAAYVESSAIHAEAVAILEREGLTVKMGSNSYEVPHPALTVMNRQAQLMCTLATKLRLTPQSRISPELAGREKKNWPNKRPGLLFGGRDSEEDD